MARGLSVPPASLRMSSIAGDGWLAAGDAAAAYDPPSSYGIAAALGSGYYAARAAADLLSGRTAARPPFLGVMRQAWDAYCLERRLCHSLERRRPVEPFRARRHAAA
jgi:flavin-dependent dehydrogenase